MTNAIDLTPILQAVITLAAVLITGLLIPVLKKKMSKDDFETLSKWVEIGVYAAEQLYGAKTGEAKKQYVLNFLAEKGYSVNSSEIDNLIEAEVKKLSEAFKAEI